MKSMVDYTQGIALLLTREPVVHYAHVLNGHVRHKVQAQLLGPARPGISHRALFVSGFSCSRRDTSQHSSCRPRRRGSVRHLPELFVRLGLLAAPFNLSPHA
jgi:hypothetical protein